MQADEQDTTQGKELEDHSQWWRRAAIAVMVVALIYASFVVNIPIFFEYLPGPVRDVESLIHVTGAPTYSSQGHLYLTTVYIDVSVTLANVVESLFRSDQTIVLRQQVTGGQSIPQLLHENRQMMDSSQKQAEAAVLPRLNLGHPTGDGAQIEATAPGSPSQDVLRKGDVVVAVDGHKVDTTCAAGRLVQARSVGDVIALTVERDGSRKQVSIKVASNPQDPRAPYLGVVWQDVHYRFHPQVHVSFATGRIVGPSAGLLLALSLYDKLTPGDLTGGRKIAGTGTIQCDGAVGPIGGIQQKVSAAQSQGAQIFLAPDSEAKDALAVAHDIKVVPISSFDGAVNYLENLNR
ncbi:MAG: Lon-like protease [Actinomycetota bacterium]|jgi:PDZ domain-containing protein|nr:Lon-like protease [Actinomycetota bacterium]